MNDYMRALHQRFFREPDVSELEEDIENSPFPLNFKFVVNLSIFP